MHLHPLNRQRWQRAAIGVTAVTTWILTVALFGAYALALQASLGLERWLLGGAAWGTGLIASLLVAKLLRNQ